MYELKGIYLPLTIRHFAELWILVFKPSKIFYSVVQGVKSIVPL